jgi:hypothetical protein
MEWVAGTLDQDIKHFSLKELPVLGWGVNMETFIFLFIFSSRYR